MNKKINLFLIFGICFVLAVSFVSAGWFGDFFGKNKITGKYLIEPEDNPDDALYDDGGERDTPFCGDGVCLGEETCYSCSSDCGSCCGDGICNYGENDLTCSSDCQATDYEFKTGYGASNCNLTSENSYVCDIYNVGDSNEEDVSRQSNAVTIFGQILVSKDGIPALYNLDHSKVGSFSYVNGSYVYPMSVETSVLEYTVNILDQYYAVALEDRGLKVKVEIVGKDPCVDTDFGLKPLEVGSVSSAFFKKELGSDFCIDANTLQEFYCYNGDALSFNGTCVPGSCVNSACTPTGDWNSGIGEGASCTDSDGDNPFIKNKGEDKITSGEDFCFDENTLIEYSCFDGNLTNRTYSCTFGCDKGVCLEKNKALCVNSVSEYNSLIQAKFIDAIGNSITWNSLCSTDNKDDRDAIWIRSCLVEGKLDALPDKNYRAEGFVKVETQSCGGLKCNFEAMRCNEDSDFEKMSYCEDLGSGQRECFLFQDHNGIDEEVSVFGHLFELSEQGILVDNKEYTKSYFYLDWNSFDNGVFVERLGNTVKLGKRAVHFQFTRKDAIVNPYCFVENAWKSKNEFVDKVQVTYLKKTSTSSHEIVYPSCGLGDKISLNDCYSKEDGTFSTTTAIKDCKGSCLESDGKAVCSEGNSRWRDSCSIDAQCNSGHCCQGTCRSRIFAFFNRKQCS